jgi:hypothetical protein
VSKSNPTLTRMDALTAALSQACGGDTYFWNRGTDARIIRQRSHETNVLVTAKVSRVADVASALQTRLVEVAPRSARPHARSSPKRARSKTPRRRSTPLSLRW